MELEGIVRGTAENIAGQTINKNKVYSIEDLHPIGITNEQMTNALTAGQNGFIKHDSVWFCTDNGTYSKDHFYQFKTTLFDASWLDLGTLGGSEPIVTQNVEIASADWVSGGSGTYSYSADIAVQGATDKDVSIVTFDPTDADSGDFASVCDTTEDTVTIYSKTARNVIIPVIATIKTTTEKWTPLPAVLYYTGTQTVKMTWDELESEEYLTFNYGSLSGGSNKTLLEGDLVINERVTGIYDWAFGYCTDLTSVTIPGSVQHIGEHAFRDCSGLTTITIQEGVTSIAQSAFYNCSSLTSVTIPSSVINMGMEMFYGCSNLTTINILGNITSIGDRWCVGCESLTTVTIQDSVTSIGIAAFAHCEALTSFNFNGTMAQWNGVSKGSSWNSSCPFTVVHCTDGDADV